MSEGPNDVAPNAQAAGHDGHDVTRDPRWQALIEGRLSPAEIAFLEKEAKNDDDRALIALYQPFDDHEKDAIFAAASVRLAARKRPWVTPGRGAAVLVLAAAMALAYLRVQSPTLELAWDLERSVAEPPPTTLAAPDADIAEKIVLRHPFSGTLAIRGTLLRREDGKVLAWSPRLGPSPQNTISIVGTKGDLFPCVPAGAWDMIIAVGTPGAPVSEADLIRFAGQPSQGSYQVMRRRVVLEGKPVRAGGTSCNESR